MPRGLRLGVLLSLVLSSFLFADTVAALDPQYAPDPGQPVDEAYGEAIAKYTTDTAFNTPLTDYLPASDTVPTPAAVLGDIAGAADRLPYAADVHRYFRMLADASPRVRVMRIGTSEEGRELIAALVADEALLADLDANLARTAQLADPRTLALDDARAETLIEQTAPVYYLTGAIHSPETGSPTALMELAYRLAVDDAPYIQRIRKSVITMITPVVEVDGRERMVDLYRWHKANPGRITPDLVYWGHYVAHDNNRDGMTLKLNLTRAVLDQYVRFNPVVLHDLHESVPFLYDNTIGDTPYNAWIDPILANEWQMIGWSNVGKMTELGLPGVFAHGDFDTWTPGYLMFIAAVRNGISRLYETYGNAGADTVERILDPSEYQRTWYRQNPPWPKVLWSQRNNNNYQLNGILTSLDWVAKHDKELLRNFWLKSKRSVTKPDDAGPAAYVLPAVDGDASAQRRLLRLMRAQHVEIHQLDAADKGEDELRFPSGSYVIRMDQPYSRTADVLLDTQYWAPDEPQKHPYDDTGWTLGALFGVDVQRVVDPALLDAKMSRVDDVDGAFDGGIRGKGDTLQLPASAGSALGLAYAFPDARVQRDATSGSLAVSGADRAAVQGWLEQHALQADGIGRLPKGDWAEFHRPRIALMHTWLNTQTEGWWRLALDELGITYDYISTQDIAGLGDLRARYDVLIFGPLWGNTAAINDGMPMHGDPLPWETTDLTPNLGRVDATPDMRPGLGGDGLASIKRFVADGGLLITSGATATWAIESGLAPGVGLATPSAGFKAYGTVVNVQAATPGPVVASYGDTAFAAYTEEGQAFTLSPYATPYFHTATADDVSRVTGRGGADDIDVPQGRKAVEPYALPSVEPWEIAQPNPEEARDNPWLLPVDAQPRALLRFADADALLVSGLLFEGGDLAGRPALVQARYGRGNVLLFGINPLWRGETIGSEALVTAAIANWDRLAP